MHFFICFSFFILKEEKGCKNQKPPENCHKSISTCFWVLAAHKRWSLHTKLGATGKNILTRKTLIAAGAGSGALPSISPCTGLIVLGAFCLPKRPYDVV